MIIHNLTRSVNVIFFQFFFFNLDYNSFLSFFVDQIGCTCFFSSFFLVFFHTPGERFVTLLIIGSSYGSDNVVLRSELSCVLQTSCITTVITHCITSVFPWKKIHVFILLKENIIFNTRNIFHFLITVNSLIYLFCIRVFIFCIDVF